MNSITIELPLAEPKIGSYCPSTFSVHLDRTECAALYRIRAGLIATDSPVMGRPAKTASGPDLIRWLLRCVAGVDEKAIPEPPPEPVAVVEPEPESDEPVVDEPADQGADDVPVNAEPVAGAGV